MIPEIDRHNSYIIDSTWIKIIWGIKADRFYD